MMIEFDDYRPSTKPRILQLMSGGWQSSIFLQPEAINAPDPEPSFKKWLDEFLDVPVPQTTGSDGLFQVHDDDSSLEIAVTLSGVWAFDCRA